MSSLTPVVYPDPIVSGSDWDWKFLFVDDDDGGGFDWTVDSWQITIEIRDRAELLLASLANFGSADGTITLQSDGLLILNLPASVTAGMPITRTYVTSIWRDRGSYAFDMRAVNVTQGYTLTPVSGAVVVQQPVAA